MMDTPATRRQVLRTGLSAAIWLPVLPALPAAAEPCRKEPLPAWAVDIAPFACELYEVGQALRAKHRITGKAQPAHLWKIVRSLPGLTVKRAALPTHMDREGPDCCRATVRSAPPSVEAEVKDLAYVVAVHLGRNAPGIWITVSGVTATPDAEFFAEMDRRFERARLVSITLATCLLAGLNDADPEAAAALAT